MTKTAHLVLGNQLFRDHPAALAKPGEVVVMVEAQDICSKLRYHKHKLVLVLAAMRNYRDFLHSRGVEVVYVELTGSNVFMQELSKIIADRHITHLQWMRPSDRRPQQNLVTLCAKLGITHSTTPNKQFITGPADFDEWYQAQKQPLMESFYRWQRKRTGILMAAGKPRGGAWNFDSENRKPLPKSRTNIPPLPEIAPDENTKDVQVVVERHFPDNPGSAASFWLPVSHAAVDNWLDSFIQTRLADFGPYEDASRQGEAFLFHSVVSPLLNCGLLTPDSAVAAAVDAYEDGRAPVNSVEGFVRQIIGWREYMYGMYVNMPELMDANYFGFTRELEAWWYDESYQEQPLPLPVKAVLRTLHAYGYNHHIERLMVLGNWFLLNEYNPLSVYRWFNSMYVDAYEWVMVPNVLGMSQYADGGVIATKPYISGGNYLQKMGGWWPTAAAAKDSEYNKLYWHFLNKHRGLLEDNFRMTIVLKQADRMARKNG